MFDGFMRWSWHFKMATATREKKEAQPTTTTRNCVFSKWDVSFSGHFYRGVMIKVNKMQWKKTWCCTKSSKTSRFRRIHCDGKWCALAVDATAPDFERSQFFFAKVSVNCPMFGFDTDQWFRCDWLLQMGRLRCKYQMAGRQLSKPRTFELKHTFQAHSIFAT